MCVDRNPKGAQLAHILHLTDLHLSQPTHADALGDYTKSQLLKPAQFQTRRKHLEASMVSLGAYLVDNRIELDSIIISGDITVAASLEGYELLPPFLERLGDALPDANRILISPGNHDVAWRTKASSHERYQALLDMRTKHGYKTAYLDGIDIDADGRLMDKSVEPRLIGKDGSYVAIGLNSSNNCGVEADTEKKLRRFLQGLEDRRDEDKAIAAILDAWGARGLYDLARVETGHLTAAAQLWGEPAASATEEALRIVSLHHQVGPVTSIEELKPFETMSNLGAIREWLTNHVVDVVLHGHTHVPYIRHDVQGDFHSPVKRRKDHRFLVIGGGTIGLGAPAHGVMASLITTAMNAPRFRPIGIQGLRATSTQKSLTEADFVTDAVFIRGDLEHSAGVVLGDSIDEVFEQLLGFTGFSETPRPLVCRIKDGSSGLQLPRNYPDLPVPSDEGSQWLADIVQWWQREQRGPGAPFNHGERLKWLDGEYLDQIHRASRELSDEPTSSRGVAVLVHPRTDLETGAKFPSFVMMHATINGERLDLVAYFRKQEIPHWWPVNMAELATVQAAMVETIRAARAWVKAGSLTSITAVPVLGEGIPSVSVPWLDRHADDHAALLSLVTPLLIADSTAALRAWRAAFEDWAQGDEMPTDGEPVPVEGLNAVVALLEGLRPAFGAAQGSSLGELIAALRLLIRENDVYRDAMGRDDDRRRRRGYWLDAVAKQCERIEEAVVDVTSARPKS